MPGSYFNTNKAEPRLYRHRPTSSLTALTFASEPHLRLPLNRRIRRAFRIETVVHDCRWKRDCISTYKGAQIESEQPETVYGWLQEFEEKVAQERVGVPFEYPAAKYEKSARLVSARGYRSVKQLQRQERVPAAAEQMRAELRRTQQRKLEVTEESPLATGMMH